MIGVSKNKDEVIFDIIVLIKEESDVNIMVVDDFENGLVKFDIVK